MKKSFSTEKIISILKEQEGGVSINEIIRKHGICKSTFHKWKSKFGGMESNDAAKLKSLEVENVKLKRLVADLSLDNIALKDVLSKKW